MIFETFSPIVRYRIPLRGQGTIPSDSSYALYGAISRYLPEIHGNAATAISFIEGAYASGNRLQLTPYTHFVIQMPQESARLTYGLAGKSFTLSGATLLAGIPSLELIQPAASLHSRFVTVKGKTEEAELHDYIGSTLRTMLEHSQEETAWDKVTINMQRRRIVTVKRQKIIGYAVSLHGLPPGLALTVQRDGIGGRRKMGGGFFLPVAGKNWLDSQGAVDASGSY